MDQTEFETRLTAALARERKTGARQTRRIFAASVAVVTAVGLGFGLTGCSSDKRGTGDSPVAVVNGHKGGDDAPAIVTNFPDRYANTAAKCLAGFPGMAVLVTTRDAAPVVFAYKNCDGTGRVPGATR
jgi:hypothetical protein